jgi:hypothetical protein
MIAAGPGEKTRVSPPRACGSSGSWKPGSGPPRHRPTGAGGARRSLRQGAGGRIGLRGCRAGLARFVGARSGRLRNHGLPSFVPPNDMRGRVAGWANGMARGHMLCSAHNRDAHQRARGDGAQCRFPNEQDGYCLGISCKKCVDKTACVSTGVDDAVFQAALDITVLRRPMPVRLRLRGGGDYPRRDTQDCDTTRDQNDSHASSPRTAQARSPFLFGNATGRPCTVSLRSPIEELKDLGISRLA